MTLLSADRRSPFDSRIVVVPNNGVARWLALGIAECRGVVARIEFQQPRGILHRLAVDAGAAAETRCWERPALGWRIYRLLSASRAAGRYQGLGTGVDAAGRYQLAQRLAQLFDEYAVYRPDWLRRWSAGEALGLGADERWQQLLWQDLLDENLPDDPVSQAQALEAWLRDMRSSAEQPADALYLFAVGALAPAQMQTLLALSRYRDVHLLQRNPCGEHWSDIADYNELIAPDDPDALAAQEVGHPLLASLGKQGRGWVRLLDELPEDACRQEALFREPRQETLLSVLQADLLQLRNRGSADACVEAPWTVRLDDASLQVHVCHSLQREVQVLHDRLLARFDADGTLEPSDVVVMLPDVEQARPYIDAVFGGAGVRIPYRVADRPLASENRWALALLEMLAVASGRFEVDRVLELLRMPVVAARFGLDERALADIRSMLADAGIRWGRDAAHRRGLGLPAEARNSWHYGLKRLLAGFLAGDDGEPLDVLGGVLALGSMDAPRARLAGTLYVFMQRLGEIADWAREPHALLDWCAAARGWLAALTCSDAQGQQLQQLHLELEHLGEEGSAGGASPEVTQDVFAMALRERLAARQGGGFLSGALTFCGLQPRRCLPARVICVLGLNEGAFPRNPSRPSFDLIQQHPRAGDRSRVDDDRWLFLECLLSAGELLYLSYTGRDVRDDSERPPSALLGELLDVVTAGFRPADGSDLRDRLVVEHPLQPFSPRYFDASDPRLFSYSPRYFAQASALSRGGGDCFRFLDPAASGADAAGLQDGPVALQDLVAFFRNPAGCWLQQALGLRLPRAEEALERREPFEITSFQRGELDLQILDALADDRLPALERRLAAAGSMPHGAWGRYWLARESESLAAHLAYLRSALADPRAEPLRGVIRTAAGELQVSLHGLRAGGLLKILKKGLYGGDVLAGWIEHLALCALAPAGVAACTRLYPLEQKPGSGQGLVFQAVEATPLLAELLTLYRSGLTQPLPLFPKAGWAWAQARFHDHLDADECRALAEEAWRGGGYPECAKAENAYVWDAEASLGDDFFALAERVYAPLCAHGVALSELEADA